MGDGGVHIIPQGNIVYVQPTISNYTPASVDKFIDVLEFGDNGELFLATSCLNRRSWTGDVWWFSRPQDAPQRDLARTGYRIDSGVVRGKYIGNNQIVIGLDSGGIQLMNACSTKHETKGTQFYTFELQPALCEHDDQLTDLDCWKEGENHLVTVGKDGRIVVWNKHLAVLHIFHPVHSTGILSVSCHPTSNHVFATAGADGKIQVWDTKAEKPCRTIYSDPTQPPGVISWNPNFPNTLLFASKTGSVFHIDVETRAVSSQLQVLDGEIKTVRFSPDRPNLCAVAGNDVTVSVLNTSADSIQLQYTNQSHKDFVRGLAWNPLDGTLWSGGWDRQVIYHLP